MGTNDQIKADSNVSCLWLTYLLPVMLERAGIWWTLSCCWLGWSDHTTADRVWVKICQGKKQTSRCRDILTYFSALILANGTIKEIDTNSVHDDEAETTSTSSTSTTSSSSTPTKIEVDHDNIETMMNSIFDNVIQQVSILQNFFCSLWSSPL